MPENDAVTSTRNADQVARTFAAEIHATFVASQLGVISITSQLVDRGAISSREAFLQTFSLSTAVTDLTGEALRATQMFRNVVTSLRRADLTDVNAPVSDVL